MSSSQDIFNPNSALSFSFKRYTNPRAQAPEPPAPEPPAPAPEDGLPQPGQTINGRYILESKLGHGQFGWVYLVRHALLGQKFAMKLLGPRVAKDPSWIERFREEARLTSLLGHPHIVFVTDFDQSPEFGHYFVMEYLRGESLHALMRRQGALGPRRALTIALKVADALRAVHEVGVVHRDLKPSNILLTRREGQKEETPKILDFGISSSVIEAVKTRKLYGTPAYMSPEQTRTMHVDARADQFSLAIILYEMLTGARPWSHKSWEEASAAHRRRHKILPPSQCRRHPELTQELDAVILRALELDPDKRWESIEEFIFALRIATHMSPAVVEPARASEVRQVWASVSKVQRAARSMEEEGRGGFEEKEKSMVALVRDREDLDLRGQGRAVAIGFRSVDRLKREWHRNIKNGGLFIPSEELVELDHRVKLELAIEPKKCVLELAGTVITHAEGLLEEVRGFGLSLEPESIERVREVLVRLEADLEPVRPRDLVVPLRAVSPRDALDAACAFLMSRLSTEASVSELRAMFAGLPFGLDQTLTTLEHKGLVRVEDGRRRETVARVSGMYDAVGLTTGGTNPLDITSQPLLNRLFTDEQTGGHISYDEMEVEEVLELVRYFERTHNYLGAVHVLRKALYVSPTVGEFYQRLALLHARFRRDMEKAYRAIERALCLEPNNGSFQMTRTYLENLERLGPPPPIGPQPEAEWDEVGLAEDPFLDA